MWAAIRYRRAQAVALLLVSALITGCVAFAPLYERALEQSLLRDGLVHQDAMATSVVAQAVETRDVLPSPERIRSAFPAALAEVYDGGSDRWNSRVKYTGVGAAASTIEVYGPQVACQGIEIVQGSCPAAAWDLAVSADEARVQGWVIGTRLAAKEVVVGVADPGPLPQPFVVTGFYRQRADVGYWQGVTLEGRAGRTAGGRADTPLMDAWVTPAATFRGGWHASRVDVVWLLRRDAVTLEGLDRIPPAVGAMRAAGLSQVPAFSVRTSVSDLVTGVVEGQDQARTIVPLLLGQLAVLAVVVLMLVASAAIEQRRPELALGRLRGRGPAGTAGMLLRELGVVVLAGVPVGCALALLTGELARRFWLTEGVPWELPPYSLVGAALSGVAAVLAVALVARPVLREPISTLLRRVPPRRHGWAVGVVDAVVVAVAAAGLVTLLSGNLSGPLALATPTLLALASGLVLAHVLVPVAGLVGRRMTARGRVVGALTAIQVARRPAVRRVMAIITVATALTTFATDALLVGARNRDERARAETGAQAVLTTSARDITALTSAVAAADPGGHTATPVVRIRQGSSDAITTLAVVPDQFARVAELPRQRDDFPWAQIAKNPAPDTILTGRAWSVTVSDIAVTQAVPSGSTPKPWTLVAFLAPVGSRPFAVTLGEIQPGATGPLILRGDVSCSGGCRLTGFAVTTGVAFEGLLRGSFNVGALTMDGGPAATIGAAGGWLSSGLPDAPAQERQPYARASATGDLTRLRLDVQTTRDDVQITAAGSGAAIPALVVGALPSGAPGPAFQAAGLDGITLDLTRAAQVPYAPGGGADEAIVNLDVLARQSTQISTLGQAQVWLADAGAVPAVRAALTTAGLSVLSVELVSDQKQLFDRSASAWGLQLALVVGLVALAIAAVVLVLVAATTSRARARDYASLRMAGVDARVLRRVGLAEQWIVIAVSVLIGALSGLLGGSLAIPVIPFFTVPSTGFPVDTTPAGGAVAIAALASLVGLLAVGAVVGVRVAGQAALSRVRDPL
ncbi:MAG: hypothetical protein M3171_04870 [Actinomycetota bacterium]|nr:hypothetical protein [Actinomycetota bacterium]